MSNFVLSDFDVKNSLINKNIDIKNQKMPSSASETISMLKKEPGVNKLNRYSIFKLFDFEINNAMDNDTNAMNRPITLGLESLL